MVRRHALPLVFSILLFVPCLLVGQAHRAELCVFRAGLFLCDTAHNGGTAELRLRFGQRGDLPFLGDLFGSGRDAPCLFRDRRFLCDVSPGGSPIQSERFGSLPAGAQPLLGDVDGEQDDGDDPCYRAGSRWVCLVFDPNVGTLQISQDFGTGTGRALLGDVDGEGHDDFCVFRQGLFVCHAFDEQEGVFHRLSFDLRAFFRAGSTVPLLGDVNGDGREDPCVYDAGRLTCGLFAPGVTRPSRLFKLSFGKAGDTPLLGDVDGL